MDRRRASAAVISIVALSGAAVFAVPIVFEDQIVDRVVDALNGQVDAEVQVGDGDVSLLRDFPHLSVQVRDLVVTNKAPFEGVVLAKLDALDVSVDIGSLMGGGAVGITAIALRGGELNARVAEDGAANWDIVAGGDDPAAADEPGAEFDIESLVVEGVALSYIDAESGLTVDAGSIDMDGSADVGATTTDAELDAQVTGLTVDDGSVTWLRNGTVKLAGGLSQDSESGRVGLDGVTLGVNDLALGITGSATPTDAGTDLDLALQSEAISFKSLLSLVPALYAKDFAGLEAAGTVKTGGTIKGLLPAEGDDLPGFDLNLSVSNGRFQYPDLPSEVSDVQVTAAATHPGGGLDGVKVDVQRFHLLMAGAPVDGHLRLARLETDPDIDLALKGKADLATLTQIAPPEPGTTLAGELDVDLTLAGRLSAFEAQDLDRISADGAVILRDATYTDAELPEPFEISRLRIDVEPGALDMAELNVRFGKSDLQATGRVDNALAYALTDTPLVGRLALTSQTLDLRPYMADDEAAVEDPEESSLVAVPDDLDLKMNAGTVYADDYELRNMRGDVRVADSTIHMDDIRADTLGGKVTVRGTYEAPTDQRADVDMDLKLVTVDVAQAMGTVDTFAKVVPVARAAKGRVTFTSKGTATLGPDLAPALPSLMANGKIGADGVTVQPDWLAAVSNALGGAKLGGLALGPKGLDYNIEQGDLRMPATAITLGAVDAELRGKVGVIDETLDLAIDLDIPAKRLRAAGVLGDVLSAAKDGDAIPITVTIGGTYKKPKVRVSGRGAAAAVAAAGLDAAVAAASAQGDKLIEEARKQADKLVAEARKQADKLVAEADKQGKALVRKAKGNPAQTAIAKEGAKQIRKQARKQADNAVDLARKQANKLIKKAEEKKDQLIAEAAGKAEARLTGQGGGSKGGDGSKGSGAKASGSKGGKAKGAKKKR
jgi:vacuolar-type H+-ATPase subunit H